VPIQDQPTARHKRRFPFIFRARLALPCWALLGLAALALPHPGQASGEAEERERPFTILFLGDSLTAGFGLTPDEAYPSLVEETLRAEGHELEVINGGLSGETTAGGLRRLNWVLRRPVDLLVVALGGNDGLRGLEPAETRANLQAIIDTARETQPEARLLLAGMLAPPNMGRTYAEAFAAVFPELAEANEVAFLPFLLEGVAGEPSLNQADGIHPNAPGQRRLALHLLEALRPLLPPTTREVPSSPQN
jgi:acyl-CoA thioesterase I